MSIKSIDTTPNPNSMKLNLTDAIAGKPATFTLDGKEDCPVAAQALLDIAGVQSIFICYDFITINRRPNTPWQPILESANQILSGSDAQAAPIEKLSLANDGQVSVLVQTFRGVPIQVKVVAAQEEKRVSLGQRFNDAAMAIQSETGADFLKERYWADCGVRYGAAADVAQEVVEEIICTLDDEALRRIVAKVSQVDAAGTPAVPERTVETAALVAKESAEAFAETLASPQWHVRLKAVQDIGTGEEVVPLLIMALTDSHPQVRRLVAAALGATGSGAAVRPLCQALLNDSSIGVRRTIGDALSDLGDVAAQPAICQSLVDENKLVRWRAARFLSEVGDKDALPFLEAAAQDPEFEVRLEVEAAIQRISGGAQGLAPAWKRIVEQS
jgi:HEAT repeat protein